jgi:acetyl-CoA decarbonylase/synthase complex subunit delta
MGFEMAKEKYTGSIKEISLGQGDKAVKVGGNTCLPFHTFEGDMPTKPKIAMEIWDMEPPEWPEAAKAPYKDVIGDPAAWAKKCVEEFGADMVVLQLKSTDPNDTNASADDALATVKKVLEAISVPLVIWGTANVEKDAEVLKKVAEGCQNENLLVGPVEDANHKAIGAAIMGYGHTAISSSPIDINLAKQINILLENIGLPLDRMVIDPTTGGLGYGLEYTYSIMERINLAALTFGDDKLQLPMINNLANEVWRCKEAKEGVDEAPQLGDPERRDILMEACGAVTYLMAGSNIMIMRHPEAVRMVRSFIDLMTDGGSAEKVEGISKLLSDVEVDFAAMSPEMDLTIAEEEKKPAKKAAPKEEKAAPKEEKAAPKEEAKEAKPEPAAAKEEPKEAKPAPAEAPKEEAKPAAPAAGGEKLIDADEVKKLIQDTVKEVVGSLKSELASSEQAEEKPAKKAEAEAAKAKEAEKKAATDVEAQFKKMDEEARAVLEKVQKAQKKQESEAPKSPSKLPESVTERITEVLDHIHKHG